MLKNWTYYTMSNINCDCKLLAAFLTASINSYLLRSTFFYVIQSASLRGRHPPPATLAQEGKIVWSGKGAMIVSESWRLENAKSPATILQENNPDATRMSIYRVCTWYFVVFAMYTYACLEACDYRAFVASMTNRHGHWVCWTSACWMSMGGKNTASSSVEHVVKVTVKRRLFLVTSSHRYPL